jgi:hypothetical protein
VLVDELHRVVGDVVVHLSTIYGERKMAALRWELNHSEGSVVGPDFLLMACPREAFSGGTESGGQDYF